MPDTKKITLGVGKTGNFVLVWEDIEPPPIGGFEVVRKVHDNGTVLVVYFVAGGRDERLPVL